LIFGDSAPIGAGDLLGTPLRFLYGHDVFTLRSSDELDSERFAEAIDGWQQAGRKVYWIGMPGGPTWPLASPTPRSFADYSVAVTILEHAYDHKPTALSAEKWLLPLAEVSESQ